ncbi:SoxR reducing system RseC family protein [Pseudomonas sp. ANT_J28]|uniref:SoxR reducing system RseC family protein n=1 Tax=Pseudomonas sp. ANT_J28 TaxID=2597352 RepID=UPI0011F2A12F|nr:SoxR reducing system RseC family protein [Pseudomonas sp. ANT_J28]KAA0979144.1 SoxR reducing system RseC family protein [Pseudomonas sp. ANT_J28]
MPTKIDSSLPVPHLKQSRKAGDVEPFPSGRITYLAPLPLPTPLPPHGPHIGELNEVYMDFGLGSPQVFSWQVILGGPFSGAFMIAFIFPPMIGCLGLMFGYDLAYTWEFVVDFFFAISEYAILGGVSSLLIGLGVWHHHHKKRLQIIPTRFNRQRREVCFMPEDATEPLFVPWESLSAWVIEAQGTTQYGIHRQYGMGIGFQHGETLTSVEFPCFGLPIAISHWEAIRGYMEYEIHDLKSIQDPQDLQGPNDPPHEGLHTFHNARARMHQQIRDGQRGRVSGFFWYLYHVMTLWTIPNHLTEWEVRRLQKMAPLAMPEVMQQWSEPLPKEQWAQPSEELVRMSEQVRQLQKRQPRRTITEIFVEVQRLNPTDKRRA